MSELYEKATPRPWTFDHDWHRIPAFFGADGKFIRVCGFTDSGISYADFRQQIFYGFRRSSFQRKFHLPKSSPGEINPLLVAETRHGSHR